MVVACCEWCRVVVGANVIDVVVVAVTVVVVVVVVVVAAVVLLMLAVLLSFLPMDGGTYKQAPYEECTDEQYNSLKTLLPESVDWENFKEYDDNVEGVQTLSCTAGGCEI